MPRSMPRRARAAVVLVAVVLGLGLGSPAGAVVGGGGAPAHQAPDDPQLPVDPGQDPEQTRQRADEILRGDEYQAPDERDRSVFDRIREWVRDLIPDFGGVDTGGGGDVVAYLVFGVVVAGGIAGIAYVVVRSQRTRRPHDLPPDAEVDVTPLRTPDEWGAEAERCEAAGDHRGAVRARFRALTTTLARRDLVADTPGRTAGELRGDVAERAPDLSPAFEAAADLFERVWFGGGTAGPEQSAAARDLAAAALAAAPRKAAVAPSSEDDR